MAKQKELMWRDLSHPVGTILERIDINCSGSNIEIGSEVNIPYFKGVFTEDMAQEILNYQRSSENDGNFSAALDNKALKIKFLKRAF